MRKKRRKEVAQAVTALESRRRKKTVATLTTSRMTTWTGLAPVAEVDLEVQHQENRADREDREEDSHEEMVGAEADPQIKEEDLLPDHDLVGESEETHHSLMTQIKEHAKKGILTHSRGPGVHLEEKKQRPENVEEVDVRNCNLAVFSLAHLIFDILIPRS